MDANIVVTQFSATAVFVWGMEQLKRATWFPLLQQKGQVMAKRVLSVIAAFFIHSGINYVWNPVFDVNGYRHLDLAIPATAVIMVGLWHWAAQFIMQESWFQLIFNRLGFTSAPQGPTAPARVDSEGKVVAAAPSAGVKL